MGAMENAGCVTLRDEYLPRSRQDRSFYEFRAEVILHEMAHMWFGDLVTMKWWDDLWLNESFAEWACYHAAVEATEFTEAWTGFTNARKNWAYRQDQLPSTHPIAADNVDLRAVEVNFDGITYAKGASVLKQLVAWVGLENFLAGLRSYFKDHEFANSEFGDLLAALEKSSGRELESLGPGVAADLRRQHARRRSSSSTPTAPTRRSRVRQTAHPDYPTLRRHRLGIGLYDEVDGRLVRRTSLEIDVDGRADRGRRAGRREAARPAAAQRRRPRLRQDPPRRALAGDRRRRPRHARRLAGPRPVLGRGLGHDPRRRDVAPPTSSRLVLARHRHRDRRVRRQPDPGVRRPAVNAYSAPGEPRRAARDVGAGPARAARRRRAGQRPPAHLRPRLRRGRAQRRRARPTSTACSTARWPSRASRSTPTCAGRCSPRWPAPAAPTTAGSTRSSSATTPSPARSTPPPPGPRARPPRPRPRRGRSRSVRDDVPNETQRSVVLAFQCPARTRCSRRTSRSTSTPPTPCGRRRAPSAPRPRWSTSSRRPLASQELLDRVDAWLGDLPANPAAKRYVREGRADVARALAAQARDARADLTGDVTLSPARL